MTQEEKQLLIKDLCARLPYGIMVSVQGGEFDSYKYPYILTAVSKFGLDNFCRVYHAVYTPFGVPNVEDVKPYLRPMSSMTDEDWNIFATCKDNVFNPFYTTHPEGYNSQLEAYYDLVCWLLENNYIDKII